MARIFKTHPEQSEQIAIFDWVKLKKLDGIIFHIANERRTSPQQGVMLKRMGVKAGVPDIFVARGCHNYLGCWIELKIAPNKPTPLQLKFIDAMREEGYCCHIAWSAEEAIQQIADYLGIDSGLQ